MYQTEKCTCRACRALVFAQAIVMWRSCSRRRRPCVRELKIYDDDVDENAAKQRYHWLKEHK